jgi:hypothetical protein
VLHVPAVAISQQIEIRRATQVASHADARDHGRRSAGGLGRAGGGDATVSSESGGNSTVSRFGRRPQRSRKAHYSRRLRMNLKPTPKARELPRLEAVR